MILSVWRFLRADPALASPAADAGEPAGLGPASA